MRETALDLDVLAQTESVFALSNGHIGLRGNLDEGEPHGLPGTYLNGFYELRPLPYAEARLRLPRVRPDGDQRHQRQDHPAAGRRRAVRRPLRASCARTSARSTCAPACCAAWSSGARRRATAVRVTLDAARLASRSARSAAIALRGRAARRAGRGSWCSPSWWPTSRCRAASGDPRGGRRAGVAARAGRAHVDARARGWCSLHATRRSGLRDGGGDGPRRSTARRATCATVDAESGRTSGGSPSRPSSSRASGCGWSSSSAYGWSARSARRRPARPGGGRPGRARCTPAGTGCSPTSASTSTTSGSGADVEIDGDAELQQAVRFALFHVLQAGGARRGPGDPGQGADRARATTATPSGTPRPSCSRCSTYTAPEAAARRAALAALDARPGPRARAAQLGLRGRGLPLAHDPRRGVLRLLAGGHRGLPRQRRHRRRGRPLPATPTGDDDFDARVRPGAAGRDRPAVALARATTTRDGRLPDRRRHRAGRVQRDRRQQRLHEPDGAAEPARRGRRRRAPPGRGRGSSASTPRRSPPGGAAADAMFMPYDEELGRAPAGRGLHRARSAGTSTGTPPEQYPLLLHFPYFDLYRKQVVKQADLVLAHAPVRRRVHARAEGARTSTTTRR